MFRSNKLALLRRHSGRDVHSRPLLSDPQMIGISVVKLERVLEKTTVRADSSASRGSAEEVITKGKILVDKRVQGLKRDDQIQIGDDTFRIIMTHRRFNTAGQLDHIECDLESQP